MPRPVAPMARRGREEVPTAGLLVGLSCGGELGEPGSRHLLIDLGEHPMNVIERTDERQAVGVRTELDPNGMGILGYDLDGRVLVDEAGEQFTHRFSIMA